MGGESNAVPGIADARRRSVDEPWAGKFPAQIETLARKDSSNGKPFWEIRLRDANDSLTLRAWSDTPAFDLCESLSPGDCVLLEGEFFHHAQFGFEARRWKLSLLEPAAIEEFFEGTEQARTELEEGMQTIQNAVGSIGDPRLQVLCERFLELHGLRFRRSAAARRNHHARRGGLCAHVAQMMRSAIAFCGVYPVLNRDLLLAGILFHDAGKLWETCPPERGFEIPVQLPGEMLGHITISIELVNRLWMEMEAEREAWKDLSPDSEAVRLHLLHVIASHHGELEFGSPVLPKTPEAIALHFIDNLDAKMEMLREGYEKSPEVAPGIRDRVRPLTQFLLDPLPVFAETDQSPPIPSNEESAS